MTKYKPYVIAAIGLILAIFFTARACKLTDKYSRLEGRYQEMLRISKIDSEILNKTIAEKEKAIAELDKKLITSTQVVSNLTEAIGKKDFDLVGLDAKLKDAKTDSERVPILTAQVNVWAEKFNLAQKAIAEKDAQIAAWESKFNAQVTISESWKQKYEDQVRLLNISRTELSVLSRKLVATRITGTIKSGLVLCALGYISYSAIKGK